MDARPLAAGVVAAAAAFAGVTALGGGDGAPDPARPAAATDGRQVFTRMGCGGCHRLRAAGTRGEIGPDLDSALRGHDRASLTRRISDPYAGRDPDVMPVMPEDLEQRMRPDELEALVSFLLAARRP